MFAQSRHHIAAVGGANLQQHAQFFVKQGFERQFIAAGADLGCPVFGIACVAIVYEHIDIQRHADMTRKRHFRDRCQQTAIALVVVRQNLVFRPQRIHGIDEVNQVFGVVQIGNDIADLIQRLRQNAACHAVLSAS